MALYTVTVANLTKGWTYAAVEGDEWDPEDDVVLVSPLQVTWAFASEVIPSQLDPFTATVNLVGRTANDLPDTEIGDYFQVDVQLGTDGAYIVSRLMRVSTAESELTGKREYRAGLSIGLTDLSVDWSSLEPGWVYDSRDGEYGGARNWWRERMAEVGIRIGYSVGCPTWWDDQEAPNSGVGASNNDLSLYFIIGSFEGKAFDILTALLNSHQPDGYTHTWATVYAPSGHPTGYRRIGPDSWDPYGTRPDLTEPNTAVRVEAVPASRKLSGAAGWPLELGVVDGVVTLVSVEPSTSGYATQLGIDAEWCIVPAKLNRTRADAINYVSVKGKATNFDGSNNVTEEAEVVTAASSDIATRGVSKREVQTQLDLPSITSGTTRPAAGIAGLNFLTYAGIGIGWAFDGVTLYSSEVPEDTAAWLLPGLMPRVPGETDGDGRLVRHVTVHDLDGDLRFQGEPVTGFITGGVMSIEGGDIVWSLDMTPGMPSWTDAAPALATLDDLMALAGSTLADINPRLTFADLEHVGAP